MNTVVYALTVTAVLEMQVGKLYSILNINVLKTYVQMFLLLYLRTFFGLPLQIL
jgi:hypothetical protein